MRESPRERVGVDTNIVGPGGSGAGCGSRRSWSEIQRERAGVGLRKPYRAGLYCGVGDHIENLAVKIYLNRKKAQNTYKIYQSNYEN